MIVTNSLTGGGAERAMNLVANELTERGWTISLVPINSSPPDRVVPICEVFNLERKWKDGLFGTFVAMAKFNRLVALWKPDAIVLNCDLPELFGATLFGKHNFIVLEHASQPWSNRRLFGRIIRRLLRIRKVAWGAVSQHLRIWPFGFQPHVILQNPINPIDMFEPHGSGCTIKRLVFIGRLSSEKRPALALEVSLDTELPLIIIGDGPKYKHLLDLSKQKSIQAIFRGRLGNPWLEIQEGDLLLVTSANEGDGLVVIEALQMGVPMLLADIPDFRRFNFPEENYCQTREEFVKRIHTYKPELHRLVVSTELSQSILEARSKANIGKAWEDLFKSMGQIHD
jgi:GalNAc-alpha-(1->4)-GalNAc-alpha-(1->3)-diNAcBac-PP-undecaprenol alpha-1,4-N-acetyl-D-galactosaminyltransferase